MVSPNANPPAGTAAAHTLLLAATQAPSSHNTQPWLFRVDGPVIELLADRTRALPVNDPEDRELTISCACALLNLRVAASAAGLAPRVDLLPDATDADLLARVHLAPAAEACDLAGLAAAITARRTCRERFAPTAIAPDVLRSLADAAAHEGAMLTLLETIDQRRGAAALVAEGDAALWADPRWRRELAVWMHPRRRGDGLVLPALAIPAAQAVVRGVDLGHGMGARDRRLADEAPLLAVLSTAGDGPSDWLAAGQALQRLLLTGVQHGLQASHLNQPVQVAPLRPRLQRLAGCSGHAQLLLRLGVPTRALPPAPRRPLADILVDA